MRRICVAAQSIRSAPDGHVGDDPSHATSTHAVGIPSCPSPTSSASWDVALPRWIAPRPWSSSTKASEPESKALPFPPVCRIPYAEHPGNGPPCAGLGLARRDGPTHKLRDPFRRSRRRAPPTCAPSSRRGRCGRGIRPATCRSAASRHRRPRCARPTTRLASEPGPPTRRRCQSLVPATASGINSSAAKALAFTSRRSVIATSDRLTLPPHAASRTT